MKASRIDERAHVQSFRLNDKCAAGTGAFIEKTARYMGYSTEEIGPLVATSKEPTTISGVCAVFAESEVINHLSQGVAPGRHHARRHRLARRPLGAAHEARQMEPEFTLIGGILRFETMVARDPRGSSRPTSTCPAGDLVQFVPAFGAAVLGHRRLALRDAGQSSATATGAEPRVAT